MQWEEPYVHLEAKRGWYESAFARPGSGVGHPVGALQKAGGCDGGRKARFARGSATAAEFRASRPRLSPKHLSSCMAGQRRRVPGYFGQLAQGRQMAADGGRVLHHGEWPHPPLATEAS